MTLKPQQMPPSPLSPTGRFTLLFAACFTIMVGSVITPALPSIAQHLGFAHASSWLVTVPSLGVVLFGALAGRFIDRFGAHLSMRVGLIAYGLLGIAAIFLTFSRAGVLANRLLLGGATALVMSAGTTLIAEFFEGPQRLRMIAVQGMAIEVGGVVFLSLGGVLGEHGWRLPFTLYLLALICLILLIVSVPNERVQHQEVAPQPEEPRSSILPTLIAATLSMTIFFVAFITLPSLLANRFHLDESRTGYFLAFISLMAVVSAGFLPRIASILSMRRLLALAFALFGAAHLVLGSSPTMYLMVLGAVLMGCAFGFSIPVVNHIVIEESPHHSRGKNLGYLSMAIFLGQFLSSFVNLLSPDAASTLKLTGAGAIVISALWLVSQRRMASH